MSWTTLRHGSAAGTRLPSRGGRGAASGLRGIVTTAGHRRLQAPGRTKKMSLGPFLACGAAMVTTPAKPVRNPTSPWYSPIQSVGAVRRSKGPARCDWRQVAPRSDERANQTSVVSMASRGTSRRRSYQSRPTVPCESTAIAGSNAKAVTPGSVLELQVCPPSRDWATDTAPVLGEVLDSDATYTVPSGLRATLGNPGCGSSCPVSGSVNMPTGWEAMLTAG